ncbi:MAG: hypothetical protein C0428_05625 [Polaromonas sp.]|nr:hypothetical protein [Polaromonas sp.]
MFFYSWLLVGFLVLVLFNYGPVDKIAPVDRIGFSLFIIGIGIIPWSMWLFFLPSFALMILGAILIVFVPTDDYYRRRDERRANESARLARNHAHTETSGPTA